MKLRLRHNSIRLRLTQGEVSTLTENGYVEEAIDFGSAAGTRLLVYAIESYAASKSIAADFSEGTIRISVPEITIKNWAETEEVGISATLDSDNGSPLSILIEKDFTCLKRREAGDEDTFPNPAALRGPAQ